MLEIGCGTGNVSSFLSEKGYKATGYEYFPRAFEIAYGNFTKVRGDAFLLPFKKGSFNIVGLFDVIEHSDDNKALLIEAGRVMSPGGIIAITVPAKEELWSYLDVKAHHKRRYTKEMLKQVFSEAGLTPLLLEYMFASLYLPMKYLRRKNKKSGNQFKINRYVNTLLTGLFDAERLISKSLSLPVGTSIIAVARKKTAS